MNGRMVSCIKYKVSGCCDCVPMYYVSPCSRTRVCVNVPADRARIVEGRKNGHVKSVGVSTLSR